jgi:hypothetical protein
MTSMVLRDSTLEFLPLSMNAPLPPILPSWVTYPSVQIESCITSFPFTDHLTPYQVGLHIYFVSLNFYILPIR